MKYLIDEAPNVADAFFALTAAIRGDSVLGTKVNELVLLGVFAGHGSFKGITTHTNRALEAGATKAEIVSAITLALPVAGIARVNQSLATALDVVIQFSQEAAHEVG